MAQRSLTDGEKALLLPIFGPTLPYDIQIIRENRQNIGGKNNSITPGPVPNMAMTIWTSDFSTASAQAKWTFVHEMAHVWQWCHGRSNIRDAIWLWLTSADYKGSYYYELADYGDLNDYNFEQQASIVADYWCVAEAIPPRYNRGTRSHLAAYQPYIAQVQTSGVAIDRYPCRNGNNETSFKIWRGNLLGAGRAMRRQLRRCARLSPLSEAAKKTFDAVDGADHTGGAGTG